MKKQNKILMIMSVLCMAIFFVACGKEESINKDIVVSDVGQKLKEVLGFEDGIEFSDDKIEAFYYISLEDVEEHYVMVGGDSTKADEVAIIKAKDKKIDDIVAGVKQRLEEQKASFKNYFPEEYNKLENAIIEQKGNYVLFAVGEKAKEAKEEFAASFK